MASSDRDSDDDDDDDDDDKNNNLHKSVFNIRRFSAKTPGLLVLRRAGTNLASTCNLVMTNRGTKEIFNIVN